MLKFNSTLIVLFLLNHYCGAYDYYSYSYSGYQRRYFDPAVATFTKRPYLGEVWFTQEGDKMHLNGSVAGLQADAILGVHIHQFGGLGDMCLQAGPHFNPFNQVHGSLDSSPRHAGDLGNIKVGRNGVMRFNLLVTLDGLLPFDGFIGRALVVHAKTDDLGTKGDEGSRTTGNSGPRLACATIGFRTT